MSWEEIQLNRPSPTLSASITSDHRTVDTPTPASLGPGRFDFGTPLSTSHSPLISAPLVSRSSQQTTQPFAVLPPRQSASVTPRVHPSGFALSAAHDIGSSARAAPTQGSLFEKMGSAKHIPNAFYKPPPQTKPSMSPIPARPPKPVKLDSATPKLVDEDVGMSSEGVPSEDETERDKGSDNLAEFLTHTKEADMTILPADTEDVPSPGFSVFGGTTTQRQAERRSGTGSSRGQDNHTSPPSPPHQLVQKDKRRVPPGAFHDAEDESDREPPSPPYIPRTRSNLPAIRPPARSLPHQTTHGRQTPKNGMLSQSIPGSLIDEDEEHETNVKEEEEEEDNVTPLPSSRPARKSRTSSKPNTSKLAPQPKTPRRSSRLSTASLSPEGPDLSPPVPAKGSRRKSSRITAAAPTVATRSSTRRKR